MNKINSIEDAQNKCWNDVISELKRGYKKGPWMQCIFPVLKGSCCDNGSDRFVINDINEAKNYLNNKTLKEHLDTVTDILLSLDISEPYSIFGFVDAERLQTSMTLFNFVDPDNKRFENIINKFFNGEFENSTKQLLNAS